MPSDNGLKFASALARGTTYSKVRRDADADKDRRHSEKRKEEQPEQPERSTVANEKS